MNDYVAVVRRKSPDDELQHHKYVKREKVGGKWKYWYENVADKLGVDERKALKSKENDLERQTEISEKSKLEKKKSDIRLKYDPSSSSVKAENAHTTRKAQQDQDKKNRLQKQAKDLAEEYGKTPIGKVEKAIESGVKAVDRFLGISAKKIREENAEKAAKEKEELFRVARNERAKAARLEYERQEEEARKKKELSEKAAKEFDKYEKKITETQRKKLAEERAKAEENNSGRRRGLSTEQKPETDERDNKTTTTDARRKGLSSETKSTEVKVRRTEQSNDIQANAVKDSTSNGKRRDTTEEEIRKRKNNSKTYNARRRGLQ